MIGATFCGGRFFGRKLLIFLFWWTVCLVYTVLFIWIPIFPCRLHRELFCFVECFMVIPNYILNPFLLILMPYSDKCCKFIVKVLKKKPKSLFKVNTFLWYLNLYSTDSHVFTLFSKNIRQHWPFCLRSTKFNTFIKCIVYSIQKSIQHRTMVAWFIWMKNIEKKHTIIIDVKDAFNAPEHKKKRIDRHFLVLSFN